MDIVPDDFVDENKKPSAGRPSKQKRNLDGSFTDKLEIEVDKNLDVYDLLEDNTLNPKRRNMVKDQKKPEPGRSTEAAAEAIEDSMAFHFDQPGAFDGLNPEGVKIYQATLLRKVEAGGVGGDGEETIFESLGSRMFSFDDIDCWIADIKTKGIFRVRRLGDMILIVL